MDLGIGDQVAIVTGASRGLGFCAAQALADEGVRVLAVARSTAGLERLADSRPSLIAPLACDLRDLDAVEALPAAAIERFGRLDILVNNAGITIDKTVLKMTDEDWYRVLAVNLSGAFFMSQAVLPHMIERGSGRIINISSIIGETGNIGQANYAASKSGLLGLTKTLAREACFQLGRAGKLTDDSTGVTVNTVAPGFIATEMLEHIPEKVLEKIKSQIPVGRLGRPDEIARAVHFLAADEASFVTGQTLSVNGGMDM
jgi:NAD(P)-dependent dehydrogenase (short-subunit alcohol dehydrogenase family)